MLHRYPWESTTQSTPLSKLKHSSPYVNLFASTPMTTTPSTTMKTTPTPTSTTTTTTTTTTNPYKFATTPFVTSVSRHTQTDLYTNRYKIKSNSNNSNSGSKNKNGAGDSINTTTRRSVFNSYYNFGTTPKIANSPNDLNYPKVSPFKYKSTVSVMSFPTTTKGYQKGLRNDGRGKRILN